MSILEIVLGLTFFVVLPIWANKLVWDSFGKSLGNLRGGDQ